eukprot:302453_1
MSFLTPVIGVVAAAYGIYIVSLFFLFTVDLKSDIAFLAIIPCINDNYDQPFRMNGLLRLLFWIFAWGLHHSLFARGWMAQLVSKLITPRLERSLYVFITALLLDWMMFDKQIHFGGGIIWNIKPWNECNLIIRNIGLIVSGYFYTALFNLGGLSLIGIPQALGWKKKQTIDVSSPRLQHTDLVTTGCYGIVRHPLQTAVLVFIWITPFMTLQKFVFSMALTIYIIIGINLEEKECVNMFGDDYITYQQVTPQLIPFINYCPFGSQKMKNKTN